MKLMILNFRSKLANIYRLRMSQMTFKVYVDDNFHYMDESERYEQGEYETYDEAVAVCKKIVDEYLISAHKDQMTADELYESYKSFGEDPFIVPADEKTRFSAWKYAKERCKELCDGSCLMKSERILLPRSNTGQRREQGALRVPIMSSSASRTQKLACDRWSDHSLWSRLGPYEPSELPKEEPSLIHDLTRVTHRLIS